MEFDGELNAVFSYRTEFDTTAGTIWRFIMDNNRTLVVIPCQTEDSPAKKAHCVPDRVGSVLAGPQGLGELANLINRIAQANVEIEEAWELKVYEKVNADLTKWRKQRKLPWLDKWERDQKKANTKIEDRCKKLETYPEGNEREKIVNEEYAKLNDEARMKKVDLDRSKLNKHRSVLEKKHRTAINKKKADRANKVEGELLEDIRKFLKKHGIKRHSIKDVLKPFYQFIKNEIYPPTNDIRSSSNKDYDLRLVVKKIKELTNVDLKEKIIKSDWDAIGDSIKADDFDQICFVAEFGVGWHFIRSIKMCVHDDKDAETFYRVAPSEAERDRIESELELEREKTRLRSINATKAENNVRSEDWSYSRDETDGTHKTMPEGSNMMRKKNLIKTLVNDGTLEKRGKDLVYKTTGSTFESYLKQRPKIGYLRKGDKRSSNKWYDIADFREE